MISWLLKQLRYVRGLLRSHDSPRQMALGLAFGMMVGLIPKGNLLAALIASCFLALRINLPMGMLAGVAASFLAPALDGVADRVGEGLLTAGSLRAGWTWLYNLPLVPWTQFNNTVVLGSVVLSAALFYPVYRLSLPGFVRLAAWRDERARRRTAARLKQGSAEPADIISFQSGPQADAARQLMRRRRFQQFVAEVESISSRRGAA